MRKSLNQLLEEVFGIETTFNENPVTNVVSASSVTTIANGNPNRLGLVICNLGANNIFVSPSGDVSSTKGLLVGSNGGKLALKWDEDFDMTANSWYAIADTTDCEIYVLESLTV